MRFDGGQQVLIRWDTVASGAAHFNEFCLPVAVLLQLRYEGIAVTGEGFGLGQNTGALGGGTVEGSEGKVQVGGQASHRDDFAFFGARQPSKRRR